ncbi:ATP-binding protein [Persephonella sp.]
MDSSNISFKEHYGFIFLSGKLRPVRRLHIPDISLFVGIERQKEKLFKNTEKFLQGRPANNVLLWGDRGTGKSSLIKALIPAFADSGLRIIQILKDSILDIISLYELFYSHPEYRFILYIDDLSFHPEDEEFVQFKTVMEGTIYAPPENLLFYVTSNQKNLIPVSFEDRKFTRQSDVLEEKLSLVDRFGLRIGFFSFDKDKYLKAVERYAQMFGIKMSRDKLFSSALEYGREAGILSGRTALNFVKSL